MSKTNAHNIIAFPDTYVVIDVETTGLSPSYDEIIELAAIKVSDNKVIDTFSSLVQPSKEIPSFICELTGITNEMVASAPKVSSVIGSYLDFIGNHILIGHNVSYDIRFINMSASQIGKDSIDNSYIDTLRIVRKLYPSLQHHRLADLSELYNIDYSNAHRSLKDCDITHRCFCALIKDIETKYSDTSQFIKTFSASNRNSKKLRASDISSSSDEIDTDNPLYGKVFVFTGTLDKMQRKEAMQIVADNGGINGDNVTKKTNYLVLGNNDYSSALKGGKSTKHKKAESLMLSGQDIQIIPEEVFYSMLSETE